MKIGMALILSVLVTWPLPTPVDGASDTLIEGAKKEGQVVFYASMEAQSAQRISVGFEKKISLCEGQRHAHRIGKNGDSAGR